RALAAPHDSFPKFQSVDRAIRADPDFIDRQTRILANQIDGGCGDFNILKNSLKNSASRFAAFSIERALKGYSDVSRDGLQSEDVQLLRDILDNTVIHACRDGIPPPP